MTVARWMISAGSGMVGGAVALNNLFAGVGVMVAGIGLAIAISEVGDFMRSWGRTP